jgi:hypothetical protein
MPRGVDDEARQPILRAAEGVSSSGAEISSGLRARAPSRDTAAPVPHGDPREVPRWGRAGSRDTAKDAYAVWCERHGAPVGVATWLVVLAAFGFASPLSRADASPATRAACAALLCASLISMALVNRLDPGIVPPSPTDDPIVETLDAAVAAAGDDPHASGAESARAAASEPATLPGGVRRDPVTGQYARLVSREAGGTAAATWPTSRAVVRKTLLTVSAETLPRSPRMKAASRGTGLSASDTAARVACGARPAPRTVASAGGA